MRHNYKIVCIFADRPILAGFFGGLAQCVACLVVSTLYGLTSASRVLYILIESPRTHILRKRRKSNIILSIVLRYDSLLPTVFFFFFVSVINFGIMMICSNIWPSNRRQSYPQANTAITQANNCAYIPPTQCACAWSRYQPLFRCMKQSPSQ